LRHVRRRFFSRSSCLCFCHGVFNATFMFVTFRAQGPANHTRNGCR
jgi:hypothetical protein